jgi:hypothetical protein
MLKKQQPLAPSMNGATPKWMVYFMENPSKIWKIWGNLQLVSPRHVFHQARMGMPPIPTTVLDI